MSRKPETSLQRRIRAALEDEVGGFWRKLHVSDFMGSGLPDLIGCVRGLSFWLEVKREGEEPSKIQLYIIARINRDGGGFAAVVSSPDQAIDLVKARLRARGESPRKTQGPEGVTGLLRNTKRNHRETTTR